MTKTPEQQAEQYCEEDGGFNSHTYNAYLAGFNAASEWVKIEDGLPEKEIWVEVWDSEKKETDTAKKIVHSLSWITKSGAVRSSSYYEHWRNITPPQD